MVLQTSSRWKFATVSRQNPKATYGLSDHPLQTANGIEKVVPAAEGIDVLFQELIKTKHALRATIIEKKYEFTDEIDILYRRLVRRMRALRDFGNACVESNAHIFDNTQVYGIAEIHGNAIFVKKLILVVMLLYVVTDVFQATHILVVIEKPRTYP